MTKAWRPGWRIDMRRVQSGFRQGSAVVSGDRREPGNKNVVGGVLMAISLVQETLPCLISTTNRPQTAPLRSPCARHQTRAKAPSSLIARPRPGHQAPARSCWSWPCSSLWPSLAGRFSTVSRLSLPRLGQPQTSPSSRLPRQSLPRPHPRPRQSQQSQHLPILPPLHQPLPPIPHQRRPQLVPHQQIRPLPTRVQHQPSRPRPRPTEADHVRSTALQGGHLLVPALLLCKSKGVAC